MGNGLLCKGLELAYPCILFSNWRSKSGVSILLPELSKPAIKVPTCGTLDQVNILADFKLSSDRSYVPNHICPFPNRSHWFPQKPTRSRANPLGARTATETLPGTHCCSPHHVHPRGHNS